MLLDCPSCASSYTVGRAEIGAAGRTVICPRCEAQWFVRTDASGVLVEPEDLRTTSVSRRLASAASARPSSVPLRRRLAPALATAACIAAVMGALGARERVVRMVPRAAGLYAVIGLPVNLRGLQIEALLPSRPAEAPADLTISGEIRNVAHRRVGVPRLAFEIRDAAGAPLVSWTERAPASTLAVGHTLPFASNRHDLPPGAATVLARFADAEAAPAVRLAARASR